MKKTVVIPQISINEDEKLIVDGGQSVTFHSDHLHYISKGEWNIINDETGIPEIKKFYNDLRVARMGIVEVQLFRMTQNGNWIVECGYFKCAFAVYAEAKAFYNDLCDWKFEIE